MSFFFVLCYKDNSGERFKGAAAFLSEVILICVMAAMQCCTYFNHQLNSFIEMKNWISASLGLISLISLCKTTSTTDLHAKIAPDVFLPLRTQRNLDLEPRT